LLVPLDEPLDELAFPEPSGAPPSPPADPPEPPDVPHAHGAAANVARSKAQSVERWFMSTRLWLTREEEASAAPERRTQGYERMGRVAIANRLVVWGRLRRCGTGHATIRFMRSSEPAMAGAKIECKSLAGEFAPVIDRSRCEGKADCVRVCPLDVFEVGRITDADFAQLGALGKLKNVVHGRKTAYTPRASACEACGKCVAACPEKAIKLARVAR
jgi:NAD-dependent dihydropyrimidine dehydrogenase PreA subunit